MNSEKAKDGKFKNIIGKNKNIIIIASTVIVLGAGIIGAYIINVENKVAGWKERIYPGVQAYGIDLGGKTKEEAHREFFEETLKCVQTFDCFNCLGHLDYIMRYGPYEDKRVEHELYQDIIDEILKTLIQKGKGIEVNTSGYALNKTCGFPNFDIVKRYKELGGTIITVGTDSHTSDRVGEYVEDVLKHYQDIGFDDVTTFTKRVKDN